MNNLPPIPPRKTAKLKDRTGVAVPVEILQDWKDALINGHGLLSMLSSLIAYVAELENREVKSMSRFDFKRAWSLISSLQSEVNLVIPYAVCPSCNGVNAPQSCWCKGQGYLSKFHWQTCVTEETKRVTGRNK